MLASTGCALSGGESSSGSAPVKAAPEFIGTTLDGAEVSLSDYRGKPLVLVFMASWCGPCTAEAPEIDRFYQENSDQAALLAVAVDDSEEAMRALMAENGWTFPVMFDGNRAASAYGISAIPTTVVIDSEGRIATRLMGGTTAAKLSAVIDGLTR